MFNLRKVTRHVLEPSGATFTNARLDFLVSDSRDFHPTDVIEDADGSLLVVDTGGWYKLCCPTSQLAKPDVLGAIYRVRRKGGAAVRIRGERSSRGARCPPQLVGLLDDQRTRRQSDRGRSNSSGGAAAAAVRPPLPSRVLRLGRPPG